MAHTTKIVDVDPLFLIDVDSRKIHKETNGDDKIVQFDHNSERFTFKLPKFVESHNMLECNNVEVHYMTINSDTKEQTKGVYTVNDLAVDAENAENVVFTWLISQNVTQIAGVVSFSIRFSCIADDGTIAYAWNTDIYKGISVSKGINNAGYIVEQYADVLEEWKRELFQMSLNGLKNEEIPAAFNKPCITISGKFSDYFTKSGLVGEFGQSMYCLTGNIAKYAEYMTDYSPEDHLDNLAGYIYNTDGTKASNSYIGLNCATYAVMNGLYGYDPNNEDKEVTFILAADDSLKVIEKRYRPAFWNGSQYVGLALDSDVGNINKALDEIIKLDNSLLGGGSV